jgi:hypothetical protein
MTSVRATVTAALIGVVAVIGAGCGAGGSGDPESTAPAPASAGSSSSGTHASGHSKAVKFAECMRDNGVPAFPDPDASGDLTVDAVANGSSIDTDGAAWKRALRACKNLQPAGFTGRKATPTQQSARLQFAQCVRRHGVKDFPDPARDAPLVDTNRIPSSATAAGMSSLNAAMRACSSFSDKAGVRPGA